MSNVKIIKSERLATDEKISFQLVKGSFEDGKKYAVQNIERGTYPTFKVLNITFYSSKEEAERGYQSYQVANDFLKQQLIAKQS